MDPDIATALRAHGIDVTTTFEQGLEAEADDAHMSRARSQVRVIVTDDTDFLRIAASDTNHHGVVFCRRSRHTIGEIIQFLILVHGVYDATEVFGRVEHL